MPEPSLKEKTAKGLFWGAINNGAQQVLVLLFGIILGRILSPDEYGMVGMLTIFTLIGNSLQESGFRAALANVRDIRHEDYNAVFWCSLLIGTCAYLLLFFCAPLIARFYQEPELTPLARYCFLAIPIASLGTAQGAYLFRNLKVRQQALSGIIAHVVSGCLGITLAFCGFSYWGIATQSLTYLITVTLCTWYFSPWRPTFRIDFRPLKPLFAFSSKLLITNIANQLNNNLLSVILGKYFNPQAVGNYNQANKWNGTGHQFITGMMGSVAQPVLASINNDRERSLRVFRKILRFCAFLAFPAMFGLSIVTHDGQHPFDAIALYWRCIHPSQHLVFEPDYQPEEIEHLYVEHYRPGRAPVGNRIDDCPLRRQHPYHGHYWRMHQHPMAFRMATLRPPLHPPHPADAPARHSSFPPYCSHSLCLRMGCIGMDRRPAPRHFPYENHHSRRVLFPHNEARPRRNPARVHQLLL